MANIFGGVEPPAWLQEITTRNAERGQWGKVAGTLGAGLINALQRDESAPVNPETGEQPRKGFGQGLWEARMNQTDPMWKLKAETAKTAILSEMAQAESAHALALERQQELKAWMQDAPALSSWAAQTPEARSGHAAPTMSSMRGATAMQSLGMADQNYLLKKENSKVILDQAQRNTQWEGLLGTMPPTMQQKIIAEGGMFITDPSTGVKHPRPGAVQDYNSWAINTPDRALFGVSEAENRALAATRKATADAALKQQQDEAAAKRQEAALAAKAAAPASPLGKLYSDLERAKAGGVPAEVLKGYQDAIDRESGGRPQTITLDNGQQALWVPGHGAHILKNPTTEAKAAMAKKRFDDAEAKLLAAEKNIMLGYKITQESLNKIKTERNAAERDWLNLYRSLGAPVAPTTAPSITPAPAPAKALDNDPLGLF